MSLLTCSVCRFHRSFLLIGGMSPVQCRSVTDIQRYREVDQSHLHLVPAQSTMRKFKLKLQEKEMKEKKELELKLAQEAGVNEETKPKVKRDSIQVSNYIERQPSDILRAICSQVGRDFTAPDARFHDDPYLTPYNSFMKRDYILSKDGGRRTARYILDNHPELFENNLIEAQPPIKAFMPRAVFKEEKATLELLEAYLEGHNILDAIKVYQTLLKKGENVDAQTRQALLEMICYYNEEEAPGEDHNTLSGVAKVDEIGWKSGGVAEDIYSSMEPITDEARLAILHGMAKHNQYNRGWQIFQECQANDVKFNTENYNAAFVCVPVEEGIVIVWPIVLDLLKKMKENQCAPNNGTLIAVLQVLRAISFKEYSQSCNLALSTWNEFKSIGIQPSLAAYKKLGEIFCKRTKKSGILNSIMDEIEQGPPFQLEHQEDMWFFSFAMATAGQMRDMNLGYKINEYVEEKGNDLFISDFQAYLSYYRSFLYLVLKREPLDRAMEILHKYTPHCFSPTAEFIKTILDNIKMQHGYKHLSKVWIDCQVSRFGGIKKLYKLEIMKQFLDLALMCDTRISENNFLNERFNFMAKEAFHEITKEPDGRVLPLRLNTEASAICDQVIQLALRADDFELASSSLKFCYDEITRIPDHISEVTVDEYLDAALEKKMKPEGMRAFMYAVEQSLNNASVIGLKLSQTFELDQNEKMQMNQYLSHDSKWQMLN